MVSVTDLRPAPALLCCSTLLVKQKLPGVYVQPSYRSALGKCLFLQRQLTWCP